MAYLGSHPRNGGDYRAGRANSVKARARDSGDLRSALHEKAGWSQADFVFLFIFLFASLAEAFVARRFSQERAGFARRSALLTGSPRHGLITQRSKEKRFSTRTPHRFPFHTHSQCGL